MQAKRLVIAVPLALALIVTGCGSSGKKSGAPVSHSSPSATPASSSSASPYSSGSSSASSSVALITTKQNKKLGTILAYGSKKMTVYLFEADKGGTSSCTGACAQVWPPVTGTPKAGGSANSSDFGTVKTSDGKTQVTYKGHPLYLYAKDGDAGDAYGEGIKSFGAAWYVLKPSGQKVDLS